MAFSTDPGQDSCAVVQHSEQPTSNPLGTGVRKFCKNHVEMSSDQPVLSRRKDVGLYLLILHVYKTEIRNWLLFIGGLLRWLFEVYFLFLFTVYIGSNITNRFGRTWFLVHHDTQCVSLHNSIFLITCLYQ